VLSRAAQSPRECKLSRPLLKGPDVAYGSWPFQNAFGQRSELSDVANSDVGNREAVAGRPLTHWYETVSSRPSAKEA
jgi:predicted nucleic acid-binding Zn ribbon protein